MLLSDYYNNNNNTGTHTNSNSFIFGSLNNKPQSNQHECYLNIIVDNDDDDYYYDDQKLLSFI